MNKLKMHSTDMTQANIDKLAELFPNCVAEAADGNGIVKLSDIASVRRTFKDADGTRVKFRLLPAAGGITFHDFLLKEEQGQVQAIDVRIASTGEDYSQSMRRFSCLRSPRKTKGSCKSWPAKKVLC